VDQDDVYQFEQDSCFSFLFVLLFECCSTVMVNAAFILWAYFRSYFVPFFFAHVVSSLAYPNLFGNKRLGCCCCSNH
jgi:hypothetical protein